MIIKALFEADEAATRSLASAFPGLSFEGDEDLHWLWGEPLALGTDHDRWREQLEAFSRKANTIIALLDPGLKAIRSWGSIQTEDGNSHHFVMLAEPLALEVIISPVTLSARGGGPPQRPLSVRAIELSQREPRFERATNILAEAGDDLTKLYMVMELIEKAHGSFPKKNRPKQRADFCRRIQVEQTEWEALHRSARPYRHAEPHEDEGPILTPTRARSLLQHSLKLWLEREVPI